MLRRGSRAFASSSRALNAALARAPSQQQQQHHAQGDAVTLAALQSQSISPHKLEQVLGDTSAAVRVRRAHMEAVTSRSLAGLPAQGAEFDSAAFYEAVHGANCESVIGFLPIPVGVVGPLSVDGVDVMVPMATTEGALIASTNRGARAIQRAGGAQTAVMRDGMTRSPVLAFPTAVAAADFAVWIEMPERVEQLRKLFAETTRFGHFVSVKASVAGRNCFLRFRCTVRCRGPMLPRLTLPTQTGDAMGMNMVGKGVQRICEHLASVVPGLELVALSGNTCTDKKPSAVNWIEGRGKSVLAEALVPAEVVRDVLKTTVDDICRVGVKKNLVGSSVAGSIGGNNAHAANVVTACFLATGQDPAQNVESSNCMTLFENVDGALHCSVTMPSLEVGTVGGGTVLAAQSACLNVLGVRGASAATPGDNAKRLACVIAATVLAGEVSLTAALASNHLVSAHLALNRKPAAAASSGKRMSHKLLSDVRPNEHVGHVRSRASLPQAVDWATPRLTVP